MSSINTPPPRRPNSNRPVQPQERPDSNYINILTNDMMIRSFSNTPTGLLSRSSYMLSREIMRIPRMLVDRAWAAREAALRLSVPVSRFPHLADWVAATHNGTNVPISAEEKHQRKEMAKEIMSQMRYNPTNYDASNQNIRLDGYDKITELPAEMKVKHLGLSGFHNLTITNALHTLKLYLENSSNIAFADNLHFNLLYVENCSDVAFADNSNLGDFHIYNSKKITFAGNLHFNSFYAENCSNVTFADNSNFGDFFINDSENIAFADNSKFNSLSANNCNNISFVNDSKFNSLSANNCNNISFANNSKFNSLFIDNCNNFWLPVHSTIFENGGNTHIQLLGNTHIANYNHEGLEALSEYSFIIDPNVAFENTEVESLLRGYASRTGLPTNIEYPKYESLEFYDQETEQYLEEESYFHSGDKVKDMAQPVIHPKEKNTHGFFIVDYSELTAWWEKEGEVRHPISRATLKPDELGQLRRLQDKPEGEVASAHHEM